MQAEKALLESAGALRGERSGRARALPGRLV